MNGSFRQNRIFTIYTISNIYVNTLFSGQGFGITQNSTVQKTLFLL